MKDEKNFCGTSLTADARVSVSASPELSHDARELSVSSVEIEQAKQGLQDAIVYHGFGREYNAAIDALIAAVRVEASRGYRDQELLGLREEIARLRLQLRIEIDNAQQAELRAERLQVVRDDCVRSEVELHKRLETAEAALRTAFDEGAKWVAQVDDPARSKYSMDRGFAEFLKQIGSGNQATMENSDITRRSARAENEHHS